MKNLQACLIAVCGNNIRRRTFFLGVLATVGILATVNYLKDQKLQHLRGLNDCFRNDVSANVKLLPDIEAETVFGARNVFFLETSCSITGHIGLNARQLCAIESAAKNNPSWQIYVLFAANIGATSNQSDMVNAVLTYENVRFRRLNLTTYGEATPLSEWMREGRMFESNFVNSHLSDVLRYLTLYKYGGTYLDLDVVVLRDLDLAGVNYSGAESGEDVAAGVMNFEPDKFGHQVAEMCVRDLLQNFNGFDWGNNGPGVITRVLQSICLTTRADKMTRDRCYGFNVYPPSAFYAIPWRQYQAFFNESAAHHTLQRLADSFIAHVWNKHSHKLKLKVGSTAAYAQLAATHCPKVFSSCGDYF